MILAHLDWSEEAAPILEQMRLRDRAPYPASGEQEVLDRRPDLGAAGEIALKAWVAASSERSIGFGLGQIPQRAIDSWCDRHIRDPIAAEFLSDAIRHVDGVVLQRQARTKGS